MSTSVVTRETAILHGRAKKRINALTAVVCGVVPAVLLGFYSAVGFEVFAVGVAVGLIWGNAFEYVYHRWLLHRPRSTFGAGHLEHHANIGTSDEAEHVALASSPLNVFLLFAVNGILAVLISFLLGLWGILSGVFIGWAVYLIAAEEIHWRIHMNEWLPPGLRRARGYHMSHHDIPNSRFNVFLPLFDLLMGGNRTPRSRKVTI